MPVYFPAFAGTKLYCLVKEAERMTDRTITQSAPGQRR